MALLSRLFGRRQKEPVRGHLRVHALPDGTLTGVEVLSPLAPEEVPVALDAALKSLEARRTSSSEARLVGHLKAVRSRAGMVDRLRGRASHREEAAHDVVPAEVFAGVAGPLTVRLDGRFGYRSLEVVPGTGAREAGGYLSRAFEEACKACEARWQEVVLGPEEEASDDAGEGAGDEGPTDAGEQGP